MDTMTTTTMTEDRRLDTAAIALDQAEALLEAARLVKEYEPKMAATLVGKAHTAMIAWSKLVEGED